MNRQGWKGTNTGKESESHANVLRRTAARPSFDSDSVIVYDQHTPYRVFHPPRVATWPVTQKIAFMKATGIPAVFADRSRAIESFSDLIEPTEDYPRRYRAGEFPPDESLIDSIGWIEPMSSDSCRPSHPQRRWNQAKLVSLCMRRGDIEFVAVPHPISRATTMVS